MRGTAPNRPPVSVTDTPVRSPLHTGETGLIGRFIGEGSFGKALDCFFPESDVHAIVKYNEADRTGQMARAEYDILTLLDGAAGHAPKPFGMAEISVSGQPIPALVESKLDGCSLKHLVETDIYDHENVISASYVSQLGLCILEAVREINARGVRHGDLSYTNVLVQTENLEPNHCDIIDFGQAAEVKRTDMTMSRRGTIAFSAPEMFGGEYAHYKDDPSADMYSIGALMFYARLWGRCEMRSPGSYLREYSCSTDGASLSDSDIVDFKRKPLDLATALKALGSKVDAEDRRLASLIYDLTSFDPLLRPKADECQKRLTSVNGANGGMSSVSYWPRVVLRSVRRVTKAVASRAIRMWRLLSSVHLLFGILAIAAAIILNIYYSTIEIDENDVLWHMIDGGHTDENDDDADPRTPKLVNNGPKLSLEHLDTSAYGDTLAFFESPKFIASDGYDAQGNMSFTDTRELLVVDCPSVKDETPGPITWCDNAISFYDSTRGGTERLSYHYLTPTSESELQNIDYYLDFYGMSMGTASNTTRNGVDYTYAVKHNLYEDDEHVSSSISIACYARRSDTCILEAFLSFSGNRKTIDAVSEEDLLDDLLGKIEIKTSNFEEVSASSPFSDLVLLSEDGNWKARIKRDRTFLDLPRKEVTWYLSSVDLATDYMYSESFHYDFAPDFQPEDLLRFSDYQDDLHTVITRGAIESDDFEIGWSLAGDGSSESLNTIRVCMSIDTSCLLIEGTIAPNENPEDVALSLVLDTVEISPR